MPADSHNISLYEKVFKGIFDFSLSLIGLILLSVILIPFLIPLLVSSKGKILFIQSRPGKFEKEIKIIKFKTMTDEKDSEGNPLPNDMRLTSLGKILRKYSLDELPQLINVIKGEMSLIGPRPLLFKYLPLYSEEQRKRHLVKPGITGLAQVNGRNAISWKEKFEYDVWYVHNISFSTDLKILWQTFLKVFKPEGINASEHVTMPPFNGNN